jgi:hypothetical protein
VNYKVLVGVLGSKRSAAYVVSLIDVQVSVHISLVCAPDSASHARPWLLESQNTLNIISVDLFARDRVDDRRLDAEERKGSAPWLGRRNTSERGDDVRAGLGLPVRLLFISNCLPMLDFFNDNLRPQRELHPFQQFRSTISTLPQRSALQQTPRL